MKLPSLIVIIHLLCSLSLSQYYAKISIGSEFEIQKLYELGFKFEDTKVRERTDIRVGRQTN